MRVSESDIWLEKMLIEVKQDFSNNFAYLLASLPALGMDLGKNH